MEYISLIYVIFGVLPSLVWLSYYLLKDDHPEPKKTILRIFLWGGVMTIPALLIQLQLVSLLGHFNFDDATKTFIYLFLIIALSEEVCKFLVVRLSILNSADLDEPLDVMLYMIVSSLGFAAFENILYLFGARNAVLPFDQLLQGAVSLTFIRFIGATFLHTLCSGIVGYFLALEISYPRKKFLYAETGIMLAVLLHGMYNFSIMELHDNGTLLTLFIILLTVAFLTILEFNNLKKMKSITKI